MLLVLIAGRGN